MVDLIVKSKIKEAAPDCNVSSDVPGALSKLAEDMIKRAADRANANGRRTVQAKDVHLGKKMAKTMLVVKSKVKDVVPKNNVSGDFADALNEIVVWFVVQGCERAKANGRRTLQARDL